MWVHGHLAARFRLQAHRNRGRRSRRLVAGPGPRSRRPAGDRDRGATASLHPRRSVRWPRPGADVRLRPGSGGPRSVAGLRRHRRAGRRRAGVRPGQRREPELRCRHPQRACIRLWDHQPCPAPASAAAVRTASGHRAARSCPAQRAGTPGRWPCRHPGRWHAAQCIAGGRRRRTRLGGARACEHPGAALELSPERDHLRAGAGPAPRSLRPRVLAGRRTAGLAADRPCVVLGDLGRGSRRRPAAADQRSVNPAARAPGPDRARSRRSIGARTAHRPSAGRSARSPLQRAAGRAGGRCRPRPASDPCPRLQPRRARRRGPRRGAGRMSVERRRSGQRRIAVALRSAAAPRCQPHGRFHRWAQPAVLQ